MTFSIDGSDVGTMIEVVAVVGGILLMLVAARSSI